MWPLLLISLSGCAAASTASSPIRSPISPPGSTWGLPAQTVVIDAGHGGKDPGTHHFGLQEKSLALDIVKRLGADLQARGLTVALTRDVDIFIPLNGRPAVANRMGADLFVSVHINANRNSRVAGVEVYYPRVSVVSSSTQWPPHVASSEIYLPSATIKQVLWDMVLGHTRSSSRRLALSICRAMRERLGAPCRGVKPARFVVLREAWMPAVLVEVGYVTNQAEASRLASAEYRQAVAEAVSAGIAAYIRQYGTTSF